jgi:ribA/ribD-fused uncharacterized protein
VDLDKLQDAVRAGEPFKYLFFWGHRPRPDGRIDISCFSQWWEATFTVNKVRYPTAEHYMMSEKAKLFGDADTAAKILQSSDPETAKQLGREVRSFSEKVWERARLGIVINGSEAKFGQNPALADFLLNTGDQVLVEASPTDRVWGIGLGRQDPRAADPLRWRGLNLLGFALMAARERIAKKQ